MISQNIFIEEERWNRYSHPLLDLQELQRTVNAPAVKLYFTQKNMNMQLLKQVTNSQLHKSQCHIKSSKIKAIFKEKARRLLKKKGLSQLREDLDMKFSSITNVCEDEEQQVSQYLSIWEEEDLLVRPH